MKRNVIETIMGAIVLVTAISFFYTIYKTRSLSEVEGGYHVSANFDDVSGVAMGTDVRIGGIKIGVVDGLSINKETYQAQVSMLLKDDIKIPDDSSASVFGDGLLGGKFVAIEVGGSDENLESGDKIEFTQSSVSLEQMIGKFMFSGGGVEDKDKKTSDSSSDADDELSMP